MGIIVNGCCGGSLRFAGIIHGWINIVFLLLAISSTICRISQYDPAELSILSYNFGPRTIQEEQIALLIYLFDALISGLLLIGISKNKHLMLLPWLILRAIALMVAIPIGLLSLILIILQPKLETIFAALFFSFVIGLLTWSWIVIYSLYDEIRKTTKKQLPLQLPYYESQSGPIHPAPPYQVYNNNNK